MFLFFDLGNVLVTFDHKIAAHNLAEVARCNLDRVLQTVFKSDLQLRYETGLVTDDQYAQEINAALGSRAPTAQVLEAVSDIFQPNWPILEVLEQVRSAGIPMGILSNTCEAHWQWLVRRNWPMLDGWFQHHVLSYRIGSMKPHRAIYEECEKLSNRSGEQIFFTDDRPENIAAASQRGWATHQFRDAHELSKAIERWMSKVD